MVVFGVLYIIGGLVYFTVMWDAMSKIEDVYVKEDVQKHAARLTLLCPIWLLVLLFYEVRGLTRMAKAPR